MPVTANTAHCPHVGPAGSWHWGPGPGDEGEGRIHSWVPLVPEPLPSVQARRGAWRRSPSPQALTRHEVHPVIC